MSGCEAWLEMDIAVAVLWMVVFIEALVLALVVKLIGDLWTRLPPVGARGTTDGLRLGVRSPVLTLPPGSPIGEALPRPGRPALITFMRTTCSACGQLAPNLETVAARESRWLDSVAVYLDLPDGRFDAEGSLFRIGAVASTSQFNVSATPYAVAVDSSGIVAGNGVVNTLDHLLSLVTVLGKNSEGAP